MMEESIADISPLISIGIGLNLGYVFIRALSDSEISRRTALTNDLIKTGKYKYRSTGSQNWQKCEQEYRSIVLAISEVETSVQLPAFIITSICVFVGLALVGIQFGISFNILKFTETSKYWWTIVPTIIPIAGAFTLWVNSRFRLATADKHIKALKQAVLILENK